MREIDVGELAGLLGASSDDPPVVIDVREPDEFTSGHVPGARSVPLGEVAERVEEFRTSGTTYVICRSGGRSMRACEIVAPAGIDVCNVRGGTLAWLDAGYAVETGTS